MGWKTRVPRLRTFLLTMAGMFFLLMYIFHYNYRQASEMSKNTGLGSVAGGGWDPISVSDRSEAKRVRNQVQPVSTFIEGLASTRVADRDELLDDGEDKSQSSTTGKMLVRVVSLQLLVKNVVAASSEIESQTATMNGEVEKADIRNDGSVRQADLLLRIPSVELEEAVAKFSQLAIRVQNQHRESRDISREFRDSEARLRNMKSEEEQYLVLLKRAGSMKDTLQVTEKVSEVRGQIEELQGELNWRSHQVAMSAVQIQLVEEPQATIVARWRPLNNAKSAVSGMLTGLGEWCDWVVALVIDIPLIAVWCLSIGGLALGAWRALRWVWMRCKPRNTLHPRIEPSQT